MKTVFKSDEIAHVWAHEIAPRGKSPGNASFDGDSFYSYSTVIARRMRYGGRIAYLLDRASFSNSTSKIQGRVAYALPSGAKVFRVKVGQYGQRLDWSPQHLRDFFLNESKLVTNREPSRYERKRAEQYMEATAALHDARDVCEFFGLPFKAIVNQIAKREEQNCNAAQLIKEATELRAHNKELKERREAKERLARNIEYAENYLKDPNGKPLYDVETRRVPDGFPPDLLARFIAKAKENNAAALGRWRDGEAIELPHDLPVMLRAEYGSKITVGGDMVTSKGARVPLGDAEKTFHFVTKLRAKGWHRNGETHAIGGYQLDAVNEQGVVAGCHRVSWEEIDRFAKAQGWL